MKQDHIQIPAGIRLHGVEIPAGVFPTRIDSIGAVYKLCPNTGALGVIDGGEVRGLALNDILGEAPDHYAISQSLYSGSILCGPYALEFSNNQPVNFVFTA